MGSRDFDKSGFGGGGNQLAQYITNRALLNRGQMIQQQFNQNLLDPSQAPPFLHPKEADDYWRKPSYDPQLGSQFWETTAKEPLPNEVQTALSSLRNSSVNIASLLNKIISDPELKQALSIYNPATYKGFGDFVRKYQAQAVDPDTRRRAGKLSEFLATSQQEFQQVRHDLEGARGAVQGSSLIRDALPTGEAENPVEYFSKSLAFIDRSAVAHDSNVQQYGNAGPGRYAVGFFKNNPFPVDSIGLRKSAIANGINIDPEDRIASFMKSQNYSGNPLPTFSQQAQPQASPSSSGIGGIFPPAQAQGQAPSPQASPSPQGGDEKAQFLARMLARNSPR